MADADSVWAEKSSWSQAGGAKCSRRTAPCPVLTVVMRPLHSAMGTSMLQCSVARVVSDGGRGSTLHMCPLHLTGDRAPQQLHSCAGLHSTLPVVISPLCVTLAVRGLRP